MRACLAILVLFVACSGSSPLLIERGELAGGDASAELGGEPDALDLVGAEDDPGALDLAPPPDTAVPEAHDQGGDDAQGQIRLVTNGEYLPLLKDALIKAKTSIQVVTLEFLKGYLTDEVMGLLKAAQARGVSVRVLLDDNPADNAGRVAELVAAGAQARLDGSSRALHVKLVVVDRTWAMVGSTNLSVASLKYNNEANVMFADPVIAQRLADYADALWASDAGLKKIEGPPVSGVTLIGDAAYDDMVLPIIAGAKQRIRLVMYDLDVSASSAKDLADATRKAAGRGVDVKAVLELSDFADNINADNQAARQFLTAGGVAVRMDPKNTTTHAKLLVVDDTVVVYSGNWTYSSLERNHEAGAIISSDPEVAAKAAQFFDAIWATSN